jgi:hypothetical protein
MGNRRMTRLTNASSKKSREPRAHDGDLLHALQFRAYPSNFEDRASDGRRDHVEALEMADMVKVLGDWEALKVAAGGRYVKKRFMRKATA